MADGSDACACRASVPIRMWKPICCYNSISDTDSANSDIHRDVRQPVHVASSSAYAW
jgi:hypothetical protein